MGKNAKLAFIGLGVIVGTFILASILPEIFPGQDPAGKAMTAGLIGVSGLLAGLVFLFVAAVRKLRG